MSRTFLLAATLLAGCGGPPAAAPTASANTAANTTSILEHTLSGLDGAPLETDALRGKVLLVDVWATWCPPCLLALPAYAKLHRELGPQGFEVVAINVDEDRDLVERFLTEHPLEFRIAWDPKGVWPERLDLRTMPTSYLVDRDGVIRHVHAGFHSGDENTIATQIRALLGATPAPAEGG